MREKGRKKGEKRKMLAYAKKRERPLLKIIGALRKRVCKAVRCRFVDRNLSLRIRPKIVSEVLL
jgi:hypothetical protein